MDLQAKDTLQDQSLRENTSWNKRYIFTVLNKAVEYEECGGSV